MSLNAEYVLALVAAWRVRLGIPATEVIEVRIMDRSGMGYHFTASHHPRRWYYKAGPDADHYNKVGPEDIRLAITRGGPVQVFAGRRSVGVWAAWAVFVTEIAGVGA